MKKKILTRNKNNNDLNIFLSKRVQSEKKVIFKTVQESQDLKNNPQREARKNKYLNIFLHHMNARKRNKKNNSTKILIFKKDFKKKNNDINSSIISSKHDHSLRNIIDKQKMTKEFNKGSKLFINNIIRINKPKLLGLLNRNLINIKAKTLQTCYSSIPSRDKKLSDDYFFDKSTSTRINNENKINKNNINSYKRYNTENNFVKEKENKIQENKSNFLKTFKKFPKIHLNFPFQLPNSINSDKKEMRDKVNILFFKDEKLKTKLRKALYFELNFFKYDNDNYNEYKKSTENYINYIYDINIIPHIKNKFLYSKTEYEPRKINKILFSKNLINKEDAKSLNKFIINNMKKEEEETKKKKQKEKKMKELSISNNYLQKLCLDIEDEEFPKMTSDEVVELSDFFGKIIHYKSVTFASKKLKSVVYKESKYKSYKNDINIHKRTNFPINT